MLTQDQIEQMLESAKPSIIESLKTELKQSISYEMKAECQRQIMAAVHADSTELPEEIADLLTLEFVQIDATERRAIINWA